MGLRHVTVICILTKAFHFGGGEKTDPYIMDDVLIDLGNSKDKGGAFAPPLLFVVS